RRRHTRFSRDWSSDVCSSDLISFLRPLRKTQLYFFGGIGQGAYRSTATFTDMRLFTGDYYLTSYFGQGTPNPNFGLEVEEKYERSEERRVGKECRYRWSQKE